MEPKKPMLEVIDLYVNYGYVKAISGVSFYINPGECVALLGGNGAGKTTILNTISGLLRPAQGTIVFNGKEIQKTPPHKIVSAGIVQVPEGRKIFPGLQVYENLLAGAYQRNDDLTSDIEHIYELFPILKERSKQRGDTLSGGEQQMLAIARALIARPKLLMLDEPSLGLAPIIVEHLFEVIGSIKNEITILLVEQNAHLALELADRAYILQQGKVVREGTSNELSQSDWIREAYLGS